MGRAKTTYSVNPKGGSVRLTKRIHKPGEQLSENEITRLGLKKIKALVKEGILV